MIIALVLKKANQQYECLLQSGKADQSTYNAGWNVEELSRLNVEGRRIVVELKVLMQSMQGEERIERNHKLCKIGIDLAVYLKGKYN